MKRLLFIPTIVTLLLVSSCVIAPVVPPIGGVYTNFEAPLDINLDKTIIGNKEGQSRCTSILWMVSYGNCSTHRAAENGDIQVIKHADYGFTNILFGIVQILTVKVYGD